MFIARATGRRPEEAKYVVRFKPGASRRFWFATPDKRCGHTVDQAKHFDSPAAARIFAREMLNANPDIVIEIKPVWPTVEAGQSPKPSHRYSQFARAR